MTGQDDSTDDSRQRIVPGADIDAIRRDMWAAMYRLSQLEDVMLEMLRANPSAAAGAETGTETAAVSLLPAADHPDRHTGKMPGASLSRQVLDDLAHQQGQPPVRGLRLIGDGVPRQSAPIYLRIDRHLRLRLDAASDRVAVEHLLGTRWHRLGVTALKDGTGGVALDAAALLRLAGPLSPELHRALSESGDRAQKSRD